MADEALPTLLTCGICGLIARTPHGPIQCIEALRAEAIAAESRGRETAGRAWREALELSHYDHIDGLHGGDCAACSALVTLLGNALPTEAPSSPSDLSALETELLAYRDGNVRMTKQLIEAIDARDELLRALRALLDEDCYDHADMCCAEWCGMCRDEAAARKNARDLLNRNAAEPPKEAVKSGLKE